MSGAPSFKITARATRGGYRGVALLGGGVVAMKTIPVFRSEEDAKKAMRTWLTERGAHADRHANRRIPYRQRKFIPKKFYALPERAPHHGGLPLADPRRPDRYDAAHVRNAAARLSMMRRRGSVTAEEYRRAERAIMKGACATGVERTCHRHLRLVHSRATSRVSHELRAAAYAKRNSHGRFTRR